MGKIYKPHRGTLLNRNHPLSRDLVRAWLMNEYSGEKVYDYAADDTDLIFSDVGGGDAGNRPIWGSGGVKFQDNGGILYSPNGPLFGSDPFSIALEIEAYYSSSGDRYILCRGNVPDLERYIIIYLDGWTDDLYFLARDDTPTSAFVQLTDEGAQGRKTYVMTVEDDGYVRVYRNGILAGTSAGTISATVDSVTNDDLDVGESGGTSYGYNKVLPYLYMWTRALSADEAKQISSNPYQIFERPYAIRTVAGIEAQSATCGTATISLSAQNTSYDTSVVKVITRSPIIKPSRASRLNKANPLNRGLKAAWLFNETQGTILNDYSGNNFNGDVGSSVTWHDTAEEEGLCVETNNDVIVMDNMEVDVSNNEVTLIVKARARALSGSGFLVCGALGTSYEAAFYRSTTGPRLTFFYGNNSNFDPGTQLIMSANTWYTVAATVFSDGTINLYTIDENGALESRSGSGITLIDRTNYEWVISGRNTGTELYDFPLDAYIVYAYVYNRGLHEEEIRSIAREPYQLFSQPRPIRVVTTNNQSATCGTATISASCSNLTGNYTVVKVIPKSYIHKPPRGVQLNKAHPLARGLQGAWLFNEGSGEQLTDYSGYENHGTLTSMDPTTDWVVSEKGMALDFDGSNDHVIIDDGIVGTSTFSVLSLVEISSGETDWVAVGGGENFASYFVGQWSAVDGSSINFGIWNGSAWNRADSDISTTAGWYFIVGIYKPGDEVSIYVDGILKGTDSTSGTKEAQTKTNIGRSGYSANRANLTGKVPLCAIWNRALIEEEIKSLYANPYQIFEYRKPIRLVTTNNQSATAGTATISLSVNNNTGQETRPITIVKPHKRLIKPARGVELNRSHPLSRGLVGCYLFNESSGNFVKNYGFKIRGLASTEDGTINNGAAAMWQQGGYLDFNRSDQNVTLGHGYLIGDQTPFSILIRFKIDSHTGEQTLFNLELEQEVDAFSHYVCFLYHTDVYADISFGPEGTSDSSNNSIDFTDGASTGVWWDFAITYNGVDIDTRANFSAYLNGREVTTNQSGAHAELPIADSIIGDSLVSGDRDFNGDIDFFMVWDGIQLTAEEVKSLYLNPYQTFQQRQVIRIPVTGQTGSVGTATISVSANNGSADNTAVKVIPKIWLHKPQRGVTLNKANPLSRGLIGVWPFNENSGTKVYNYVNNSSGVGTLTNMTESDWVVTEKGIGLDFPDTADYVDFGKFYDFTNSDAFTISLWLYRRTRTEAGGLLTQRDSSTWGQFILRQNGGGGSGGVGIEFYIVDGSFKRTLTSTDLDLNEWNHITAVWDKSKNSGQPKIYFDGTEQPYSVNDGATGTLDAERDLILAKRSASEATSTDGMINDVRIYNRMLSDEEVRSLYANPYQVFNNYQVIRLVTTNNQTGSAGYALISASGYNATGSADAAPQTGDAGTATITLSAQQITSEFTVARLVTKRYLHKPPRGVQLDKAHPLVKDLKGAWLFNEGSGLLLHDYSGVNEPAVLTNMDGSEWTTIVNGQTALDFNTNDYAIISSDKIDDFPLTFACWFWYEGSGSAYSFASHDPGVNGGYRFDRNDQMLRLTLGAVASYDITGTVLGIVAGRRLGVWTVDQDGGTLKGYVYDPYENESWSSGSISIGNMSGTNIQFTLGGLEFSTTAAQHPIESAFFWNRVLSEDEIKAFGANSYQMFTRHQVIRIVGQAEQTATAGVATISATANNITGNNTVVKIVSIRYIEKPPRNVQLNKSHSLSRNLTGVWLFNEGSGEQLTDYSGSNYNGTLFNMYPPDDWIVSEKGTALDFDGSNDRVTVSDNPSTNNFLMADYTELSVVALVKPANTTFNGSVLGATAPGGNNFILFRDDVGLESGRTDTYSIRITDNDLHPANMEASTGAATTDWQFLIVTFKALDSNGLRFYVDGVEDAQSPVSTASVDEIRSSGSPELWIGSDPNNLLYFLGQITLVYIYQRVLQPDEIKNLYANPYQIFSAHKPIRLVTTDDQSESVGYALISATGQNTTGSAAGGAQTGNAGYAIITTNSFEVSTSLGAVSEGAGVTEPSLVAQSITSSVGAVSVDSGVSEPSLVAQSITSSIGAVSQSVATSTITANAFNITGTGEGAVSVGVGTAVITMTAQQPTSSIGEVAEAQTSTITANAFNAIASASGVATGAAGTATITMNSFVVSGTGAGTATGSVSTSEPSLVVNGVTTSLGTVTGDAGTSTITINGFNITGATGTITALPGTSTISASAFNITGAGEGTATGAAGQATISSISYSPTGSIVVTGFIIRDRSGNQNNLTTVNDAAIVRDSLSTGRSVLQDESVLANSKKIIIEDVEYQIVSWKILKLIDKFGFEAILERSDRSSVPSNAL